MTDSRPDISREEFVRNYVSGEDRYIRFAEDLLGQELAETQKQILRTVENNKHTLIISGNGVGKSHAISILSLAYLYCNLEATVLATSGSYSQLRDTMFKPMSKMLRQAQSKYTFLPGRTVDNPPQIKFENREDQYLKCISTRNPGALEGRHSKHIMSVIEEGDKPEVTEDVIDSARSSITDGRDRMVIVANPPKDESNSIVPLIQDDKWEVVQFSSFESRNVMVDAGESDAPKIPGLVDLEKVKDDWESWNDEPWPSYEEAKNSEERNDLDPRWYRRRLGVIPPDNANAIRPFRVNHVAESESRWNEEFSYDDENPPEFRAYGVDVARGGGDRTVITGVTEDALYVLATIESPGDHTINKELVRDTVSNPDAPVIVDAIGEGSGIADDLKDEYNVTRFKAGENAKQEDKYYDKRTEALGELGQFLKTGGALEPETELSNELRAGSHSIEYEEKMTRGSNSFIATSKQELKKSHNLGRSPDLLDSASLAVWGRNLCARRDEVGFTFMGDSFDDDEDDDVIRV